MPSSLYSPLLEEQCCESCGLHQCKTRTHMSDHLYRTAPEVSRVSDIYSSSYSSQAPSVCVSLNRFCDETLSEFHSKRPDTAGRISGLSFSFITDITENFSFTETGLFLEKLHNLSECCVDLEVGSFTECFFTQWTFALLTVVPALVQAALTEVVSTWSADWISEHIQTHWTLKPLSQKTTEGWHI